MLRIAFDRLLRAHFAIAPALAALQRVSAIPSRSRPHATAAALNRRFAERVQETR